MAIVEQMREDGTKVYKYEQPSSDALYEMMADLLDSLEKYIEKQNDIPFESIAVNQPALAELFVRVDKRKDYFVIYHDETEMNEIKQAALVAYWILKFKPFSVRTDDLTLRKKYSQINEAFAVFVIYSTIKEESKRVKGRKFKISKEYNQKIMYAFKFWDISKEALILISESLCEAMH